MLPEANFRIEENSILLQSSGKIKFITYFTLDIVYSLEKASLAVHMLSTLAAHKKLSSEAEKSSECLAYINIHSAHNRIQYVCSTLWRRQNATFLN